MKNSSPDEPSPGRLLATPHSRRAFLKGMGIAAGATVILTSEVSAQDATAPAEQAVKYYGNGPQKISLKINGTEQSVEVEPRTTLLDALREQLHLTGPKEVCDRGSCGCCTVLLDGKAVTSCMMLAMDAQGHEVTTVEGIAKDPKYKAMLEGYYENDGAQCGFCIPGFVVRTAAMLEENPSPSPEEMRKGLSGNICRCGTYTKIFESVAAAAKGGAK